MHNSYDTAENNLHALLTPSDNKMHFSSFDMSEDHDNTMDLDDDEKDEIDFNLINNDNMQLLKSLLSILTSCSLIYEQFGKKKQLSAMSMVLTLCGIISDCLCDDLMKQLMDDYGKYQQKLLEKHKKNKHAKNKRFKVNDLRLFISKSLMSIFNIFPIEYVEDLNFDEMKDDSNENEDENESEEEELQEQVENKKRLDRLNIMRMNMKAITLCHLFVDYWDLKISSISKENDNKRKRKRSNYKQLSFRWLHDVMTNMSSDESINAKLMVDILQILKKLIPLYSQQQQFELLLCVNKLLNNSSFADNAKTIFSQFIL